MGGCLRPVEVESPMHFSFIISQLAFYKGKTFLMRFFLVIFSVFFFSQSGAGENSIEYKIKAGYLYNFTKFISWPENELKTFNICILGEDPFGSILDPIEKRAVKNKPIKLSRIKTMDQSQHCHIIYMTILPKTGVIISKSLIVSSIPAKLIVGESKQFIYEGGMIAFFQYKGKVKLHINLSSLRKSGLEISAKLLEVADLYEEEEAND